MKMVAASRLRRAQERIQQARPFAIADAARARTAWRARVDPARAPAARRAAGAAGRRRALLVRDHRGPRPLRQLQHQRRSRRQHVHRREPRRARSRSGLVGRRGRDYFARRGFEVRYEQVNLFAGAADSTTRKAIADARDRGVHHRAGRQRLPRLQRVQVRHVAARRRRAAAADSAARVSSADATAASVARRGADRLPARADAGGAVHAR